MKDFEYYMSLPYRFEVIPDKEDGGYVASFPDLPGCSTQADTWAELILRVEDAKRCWLKAALEDGYPIKEPEDSNKQSVA